jgi:hypothetical protein
VSSGTEKLTLGEGEPDITIVGDPNDFFDGVLFDGSNESLDDIWRMMRSNGIDNAHLHIDLEDSDDDVVTESIVVDGVHHFLEHLDVICVRDGKIQVSQTWPA